MGMLSNITGIPHTMGPGTKTLEDSSNIPLTEREPTSGSSCSEVPTNRSYRAYSPTKDLIPRSEASALSLTNFLTSEMKTGRPN